MFLSLLCIYSSETEARGIPPFHSQEEQQAVSAGVCLTPELTLLTTAQDSLAEARACVLFVSLLVTMMTWILKTIASLYVSMHICTEPGTLLGCAQR